LSRALNSGILPRGYYALAEQHAAGFGPDVRTLDAGGDQPDWNDERTPSPEGGGLLVAAPRARIVEEAEIDYYHRKRNAVVVRHVSGDRMVAVVEVISPGNKSGQSAVRSFVAKAAELLYRGIHLLILDLYPPGPRDPNGLHGLIGDDIARKQHSAPPDKPLTLAAYEVSISIRAYVESLAEGDTLPDMPLFLEPGGHVLVPSEPTYDRAFAALPARWRAVLEKDRGQSTLDG
jgi:hypothetical protein